MYKHVIHFVTQCSFSLPGRLMPVPTGRRGRILLASLLAGVMASASSGRANAATDYQQKIKPILQERCYACHGALKQEGGLRLDTAELATQGGDSGPALNPSAVDSSLLLQRVSAKDISERMPPEGEPLSDGQIGLLRKWILQGAIAPDDELPEQDPREHWAFQPPVRPEIPRITDLSNAVAPGGVSPVDAFIEWEQQRRGIERQPAVDKLTLLRRIYLDLIGIPPTRQQQALFLADSSETAYADVVESLLASPHYGERWGRHWMDIWRYSDWWGLGAEVRNSQKHIWHWRDWIVESLNADKGYDQMLREMLAADELYPNDLNRLRATGFLARQYFKFNRTSWLDETIEHTSKSIMGLTFNCCKCHDHKYDPLSHQDYYRLRAVFEPYQIRTEQIPGETDFEKNGIPRAFDCNPEAPTFVHIRGDDRNPDPNQRMEPGIPEVLSFREWNVQPVTLPIDAVYPELRPHVLQNQLDATERRIAAARTQLQQAQAQPAEMPQTESAMLHAQKLIHAGELELTALHARSAADQARNQQNPDPSFQALAMAAANSERLLKIAVAEAELAQARLDAVGTTDAKKSEADKKVSAAEAKLAEARKSLQNVDENYTPLAGALKTLESNLETEPSRRKPFPVASTGRRTAFVTWLTDERHPLTARVAVNHIWLRHMGRALVPTIFDFGRKGTPPDLPELLDWLAVEFIHSGYSMKHLHRLIVTSQAYQRTSSSAGISAETLAQDSENRWYWRANPIRMEAQVVRDSLLHLAGKLDLTLGGPPIPVNEDSSTRRAMYFVHSHNEHQKFLSMFDDANVLDCYRRAESIVPQQALALQNSALATEMAAEIAKAIEADQQDADDQTFVQSAFQTVLCMRPGDEEMATAIDGLHRLKQIAITNGRPNPQHFARRMLIQALVNHHDFITIR